MKAIWLVHWPGKDTLACHEHATKLQGLSRYMTGTSCPMTSYNGEAECANCENEAKKAKDNLCQCICDVCKSGGHCGDEHIGCQRKPKEANRFKGEEAEKILPSQD